MKTGSRSSGAIRARAAGRKSPTSPQASPSCPTPAARPGETYYYRVRAYNEQSESEYSPVASATTPTLPAPVVPPKDHLAVAVARRGEAAVPGRFFAYGYDGIGNRESNLEQTSTPADFFSNTKNQLAARQVAGTVHFAGCAEPGHAVVATIDGVDYPVHRDGAYYYVTVPVDNSQGLVAAEVTVTVRGPGGETVRTESFTRLVSAAGRRQSLH